MRLFNYYVFTLLCIGNTFSQIFYTGTIDKFPIELILTNDGNDFTSGIYVYKNFDTPIPISGNKQIDQWYLEVKDGKGKVLEQLKLYTDSLLKPKINGIWIDTKTKKMLDIKITQAFHLNNLYHLERDTIEVLQAESTSNYYFKILLINKNDNNYSEVRSIKIYEKKTDVLIQRIDIDNEYRGIYSVSIGDYNFDGLDDFSIFESSYAGPNTSRNYYLYNPSTKKYFLSDISGVSLEFDAKRKIITEHNQCCAGSRIAISQYKIKNNKMILFKETCLRWDEKLKKHVVGNNKDCQ
jgi:hypothetical protein